jgi:hypothetical protein
MNLIEVAFLAWNHKGLGEIGEKFKRPDLSDLPVL